MANGTRRAALALILALILFALPARGQARTEPAWAPVAPVAPCGARVAVLGVDMSPGGRFEVQRALAVGPHTIQLVETLADEINQAGSLIPPALLQHTAVSSALLHPLTRGAGMTVTLNPAITLDTPQTYANALLTAGIADAEVRVAAPTSQKALGTTALLGLLRAAQVACLPLDPRRRALAIREVVLTSQLVQYQALAGRRAAAPRLLAALKASAVSGHVTAPTALSTLITRDAGALGVLVPAASRASLIRFLRDLVVGGTYGGVLTRGPSITTISPLQVHVHLTAAIGSGVSVPPPARPTGKRPTAAVPTAAPTRVTQGFARGTVVTVGSTGVAVREGNGVHDYPLSPELQVYRNGQRSTLGALQAGDVISVTTTNGAATYVDAAAPSVASAPAVTPPGSGTLNTGAIAVLAALLLLLLLAVPLLIGLLRRRRKERTVTTVTTATTATIPPETVQPATPTQRTVFAPRPQRVRRLDRKPRRKP